MTAETKTLRELIDPVRFVLWDLDGPVCRLFAGHPAHQVAVELVEQIERRGLLGMLTDEERRDPDPLAVLRSLGARHPSSDLIADLEEWLTQQELAVAPSAWPTAYADPLIRTWAGRARFAVTTNNSAAAAARYLADRGLTDCFPFVYGRTRNLDLMKPHPHTLRQALSAMGADPSLTLMIGDAPTDFEAARGAGVAFLGYARHEDKRSQLESAGVAPHRIVSSLEPVLELVRELRRSSTSP
ncbi:HAD-IA family hydrolase [Streptomyces sp. NPDC012510]|uniref:HAD family hydrolase n=1 Tax=Streptomyces sp. NPDC012510 TaxID=3364838 RepID=UPI0036EF7C26